MGLFRRKPEFQITDRVLMNALDIGRDEALRRGARDIDPRYLLLGLLMSDDPLLRDLFRAAEVDVAQARSRLEAGLGERGVLTAKAAERVIPYTPQSTRALELSGEEALATGERGPGTAHLLIALLRQGGEAGTLLRAAGVSADIVREHLLHLRQAVPG